MKIIISTLAVILAASMFSSCTANTRAKNWGGKETIEIKPNERVVNLTWKNDQLWILTEDTVTHQLHFREKSAWGLIEGEINFK